MAASAHNGHFCFIFVDLLILLVVFYRFKLAAPPNLHWERSSRGASVHLLWLWDQSLSCYLCKSCYPLLCLLLLTQMNSEHSLWVGVRYSRILECTENDLEWYDTERSANRTWKWQKYAYRASCFYFFIFLFYLLRCMKIDEFAGFISQKDLQ